MYPSKGAGAYGQQQYSAQQAYGQIPGSGDAATQHALASRQSAMMGATQEADISAYRTHPTQAAQYGGPYAAVYGSAPLSSTHQAGGVSGKGAVSSSLQGRMGYPSALPESSKFSSGALGSSLGMTSDDYVSASTRGYAQKEQFSAVKSSDYASLDRRHFEHQSAYIGRELQSDSARRYPDSVSLSNQHQTEMLDHMDQTSLLRQQQMLKAQSLQSGSDMRQADYLAARAAPIHHGTQEFSSYSGRMDVDPRSLPILGSTPYGAQHAASILGGAPRRNVEDLMYGSSGAAYGVGLPPGRDYAAGKGLHGHSLESDYQGSVLSRGHPGLGVSMVDERKDDRNAYRRELEIRDEDRRRELMREREKEREREERERGRDRERERDRLERRNRERERDHKRGPDFRRERTPARASKDRRGSSLLKDEKPSRRVSPRRLSPRRVSPRRASPRRASPRRVSPRREAVHRRRSPVKEKKREYICKVYPFCLVDAERDYLSINKRYPRLSISPEFTKVVLHWPKENLHISLHTPVSFEHDFVEADSKNDVKESVPLDDLSKSDFNSTVWNAKVILMSGLSNGALNDLCSDKSSDERIAHWNNILRFAILKKDHSFMAIGGPWSASVDGGDPSADDFSLVKAARRYVKDIAQLDLQNCLHWNRFLEIHYDRFGDDGLFSHKEITVLFVPDLSECLPSVDLWRSQWLTHKENVVERERLLAVKLEKKTAEKKETVQENVKAKDDSGKDEKVKKTDMTKTAIAKDTVSELKENSVEPKGKGPVSDENPSDKNTEVTLGEKGTSEEKKANDEAIVDPENADKKKPAKKKIVKKVGKGKVVKKETEAAMDVTPAKDEKVDLKNEIAIKEEVSSADPVNVKTFVRKRPVKIPAGKSTEEGNDVSNASSSQTEKKPEVQVEDKVESAKEKKEPDVTGAMQGAGVKKTGKKKVIRRVIKKKVSAVEDKGTCDLKKAIGEEGDIIPLQKASKEAEASSQVGSKDENSVGGSKADIKMPEESKTVVIGKEVKEKKPKAERGNKDETKSDGGNSNSGKGVTKGKSDPEATKDNDTKRDSPDIKNDRMKNEKEKKSDSRTKSHKEVKEKGKSEEPPRHPGFVLQTKWSKESKVRSMSLSLDGLLDYNDKDIEESTFELSLFAESLNEMLQYQMGCRILSFLEKLRERFLIKKNQRKRQRDEESKKEGEREKSSSKRLKTSDNTNGENESVKSERQDASSQNQDELMGEAGANAALGERKVENKSDGDDDMDDKAENKSEGDDDIEDEDEEEDPEEIFEDEEEMDDGAPSNDTPQEDGGADKSTDLKAEPEKALAEDDKEMNSANEKSKSEADDKSDSLRKEQSKSAATEKSDPVKEEVVDKELLQAFRFFDHNHVGYIKVEDLRCLLHNLGKFRCHRDVKEMVQSALFESNTARDNRIFYKKLVRMTDI